VDFWDLTKLVFRRWYVSVPVFAVAIAVTLYVAVQVKPDYVATSYVQLVPPSVTPKATDDTKARARNPWLDLGLASLTKAGMISVQDQRVVKQLKTTGYSDDFTMTIDTQLPIVTFEVIGEDEAQATRTSEQLVKRFSDSVQSLQKEYGAPGDQMITTRRLDQGDNVKQSNSKVKRALIAVAGVGVLLTVALTVAVDAWLRRRRRKADADADAAELAASGPARRGGGDPLPRSAGASAVPITVKRGTLTTSKVRTGSGEYGNKSGGADGAAKDVQTPIVGEETTVLRVPPGEETIVLPAPSWQTRNGRAKGSKLP
jgi:hypothetical protein